jgi:hypothetical protein
MYRNFNLLLIIFILTHSYFLHFLKRSHLWVRSFLFYMDIDDNQDLPLTFTKVINKLLKLDEVSIKVHANNQMVWENFLGILRLQRKHYLFSFILRVPSIHVQQLIFFQDQVHQPFISMHLHTHNLVLGVFL